MSLTLEQVRHLTSVLREAGLAVCVFTPEELNGADPRYVQDGMCEAGYGIIESLQNEDPIERL